MPSVTRKPQAKRQERREQIERRLLDATERLMADGASFTELSVDRLATEAGISRASFYIYFEDKGHLLRRLAGQVFDDLAEDARALVERRCAPRPGRRACRDDGIIASYRRHQPLLRRDSTRWPPTTHGRRQPTARCSAISRRAWPR